MQLILPPRTTRAAFDRALRAFAGVVGEQWVFATDEDRETYLDLYAPGNDARHAPSAAIAVQSTAQVQAIVRLANQHRIPLWPISRGKNFGYGGTAPVLAGSVVLDLTRMNRILEVNDKLACCVLEPGVGFFDLHEHLTANRIPLWMGIPGNGWGSVIGNALERGFSGSPYGEHAHCVCGMEVVLPSGELVRTGMMALTDSPTGALFKHGYGPGWDQMFMQSNFGIVTRAGFWLMPEPDATLSLRGSVPEPDDIGWLIDVLTPLRISGVLTQNIGITSYMASATTTTQRRQWYAGRTTLPDAVIKAIMERYQVGWWNFGLRLYGHPEVNDVHRRLIERAFAGRRLTRDFEVTQWRKGQSGPGGAPSPGVFPLQIVNWHGGRGGHIGFSPILPADGRLVLEQFHRTRRRYEEFGIDYSATFYVSGRHVINVNLMLYDRDDAELTGRTRELFSALVRDSAQAGYAEYRTHLSYMDDVAETFDFNDHALRRLNETLKDALDPNGIVAPGKSGIWPRRYRGGRR